MSAETIAFEKGVDPLLRLVLPGRTEEVIAFRPDEKLQQRIDELACKSTEDELTPVEREEYEGYARANKFLAILRRQAKRLTPTAS
jgi:hypothetical protein